MYVDCKTNSGFEDQLTSGGTYKVKTLGQNSYQVVNDKGELRYYGTSHFDISWTVL